MSNILNTLASFSAPISLSNAGISIAAMSEKVSSESKN